MSGKSTFLRTIGLNIVLANSGAPVCAEKMRTPIFNLITSMRNADSLQDSTSSFYAELKRLKQVINLVKSEERVFFLLDEKIFHNAPISAILLISVVFSLRIFNQLNCTFLRQPWIFLKICARALL